MIAIYLVCSCLVILGLFLMLGIRLTDITSVLTQPFRHRQKRKKRISELTGKKPGVLRKAIQEARQMLDSSGMGEQLSTYQWLAFFLSLAGVSFGLILDNILVSLVLGIGLIAAPLTIIRVRTGDYIRSLHAKLEIGMGIINSSYLQSGDLTGTVQSSLPLLPAPLDSIFSRFLVETQFIDANVVQAIERMRKRVNNRYWRDWCSVLIQCQHDRQLRFALPGIVERLG